MARWSGIRHKMESEYLAECLKGHISYFATSYSKCPDHEGRAAILLDGKEIISGSYYNNWTKAPLFPVDEKYDERMHIENAFMDDVAIQLGVFDQRCFYGAFDEFDNQSVEKSLESENMLVRIMAMLDRRVGKRRLVKLLENMEQEDEAFREFLAIRAKFEGLHYGLGRWFGYDT